MQKNNPKIAIVHDWLVTDGGAEKVLRSIIDLYPDAAIYTLVDFLNEHDREAILGGRHTNTSFIQKLPMARKYFRHYLAFFPKAIEQLDLSGYDLIISSSWAVAKGVKTIKKQLHISYCHTPIRYAWDLYDVYTADLPFLMKLVVQSILKSIKKWDYHTADRVDYFIANSDFVKERIANNYQRDAVVIHPPVDTVNFSLFEEKEDFYLTASRLVPYKKVSLIVEAFNVSGKKLVVIGDGPEYDYIKRIARSNITVLGWQERHVVIEYMQRARAFVYAALEDFGIVPVEAMACGTPVIAYGVGGVRDSVVDGKSGLFFEEQTVTSINKAVEKFEPMSPDYKATAEHASIFSAPQFDAKFKNFAEVCLKEFYG